ncbi:unknown protein [Simkania negevensis Z]|uniref:Uncharacterized protein n=2 Tax=Simkania negevensis TaxID=83561 RepID=F8L958_SIMNZ|nr:unknown protein [Simkania negevensis Z]
MTETLMKKVLKVLIAFIFATAPLHLSATDQAPSDCDYEANRAYKDVDCQPLGYGADQAANSTINMSMIGWGLGLALAIALVAGIIHQSAATHSSSSS